VQTSSTRALLVVVLLTVGAVVYAMLRAPLPDGDELTQRCENLGTVAVVGGNDLLSLRPDGTTLRPVTEFPEVEAALQGSDEDALATALDGAHVGGILVDGRAPSGPEDRSLGARLGRYEPFEVLGGSFLAPIAALYLPRSELVIRPPLDEALAHVARSIIEGARPPHVRSFPEPLRRIRSVEVMVMLEDHGRPRLWRSARGSSIARALLTAAVVARQRWTEREAAMGGPIERALPNLDVIVYLLDEDGTLGSRSQAFVDRVFSDQHGVAFDEHGPWHYLLPDATRERGEGSAVRAYGALFSDSDMPEDSLANANVRLYRMLARVLARSAATRTAVRPIEPIRPADPLFLDEAPLEALFGEDLPRELREPAAIERDEPLEPETP
jgi:hypothetical protein